MMRSYSNLNFMDEDFLLTEEEILTRQTARAFVAREVEPLLRDAHRKEQFPIELVKRFGAMGFLGANLKGYGCAEVGDVAYGLIMQELERADSGIRSFCSVQGSLAMYAIHAFGSEAQKQKWLPAMAAGEKIGCFGLTEADAGSNPGGMKTKAEKVSGGYKLNGSKVWITNGSIADVAVIWARLDGEVRGFLVEKGTAGFKPTLMEGKFSLRVSVTSELYLKDCVVPHENLLEKSKGLKSPLSCLSQARYGIAFGVVGAANHCFNTALEYAQDRVIFDKPLSHYQLAQAKLVEMAQEITKAQLLVIQLGRLKESGKIRPEQISLAKMNNCHIALQVARTARDMLGANGIIDDYPIMRHLMNLETVNTYEGTEDIHRLVVGQALTGTPAFR
ncbi:MAG: acyl-CoA dehydrogenase family protein [Bdellovibrionales bacterium]|nr:acyl-CoA dehydrogenase family protein [Bdellovibrionales bacterium]